MAALTRLARCCLVDADRGCSDIALLPALETGAPLLPLGPGPGGTRLAGTRYGLERLSPARQGDLVGSTLGPNDVRCLTAGGTRPSQRHRALRLTSAAARGAAVAHHGVVKECPTAPYGAQYGLRVRKRRVCWTVACRVRKRSTRELTVRVRCTGLIPVRGRPASPSLSRERPKLSVICFGFSSQANPEARQGHTSSADCQCGM